MEEEAASQKAKKKNHQSLNSTAWNQKQYNEKRICNVKSKKIHQSLNPMVLNQRQ